MMDISPVTYSNYSIDYNLSPVSKNDSDHTISFSKSTQAVQPTVNGAPSESISKTSDTDNTYQEETPPDGKSTPSDTETINGQILTQSEIKLLEELKQSDSEVRRHEMAHIAAGGRYITSGANFTYQRGPDGKNYAVGGEVGIDTSPVPGDPQATLQKMRQIKSAALAPASPSAQDLKVASQATSTASKALSDLMILQAREQAGANGKKAFGNLKNAADSYVKVNNLPEESMSTFQVAG